jgi:hypothetical protein
MMRTIALPMAGDRPVLGLGGPLADHHRWVDDAALPAVIGSAMRFAAGSAGPQRPGQFAAQLAAALYVQGLIDGLVHQVPFPLAGELDRQRVADLLRAPAQRQLGLHEIA